MLTFGPVPSRRLGRSLGINNIPPKACSYSCIYCQVGPTLDTEIVPHSFYTPGQICREVEKHLEQVQEKGEQVDYLTFVPDGEPTLDSRLGETIERLRPLGIPIAVISNASLIWREEVRETLAKIDWVSLKVDAIEDTLWHRINRPHVSLNHQAILEGNLSVPTRPPAENDVHAPNEATLNVIYQMMSEQVNNVELMTGYEGNAFATTGNVAEDLLSITSVHPMREEAVRDLLSKAGSDWHLVEELIDGHQLIQTEYEGRKFYVRRLQQRS